ncbi:Major Facilitator Superfamily protein [Micromonospora coriariae]|uniref:Major Facilitator Superfamily protein n=1 Tax=Micromonospora coriariae TaxID=285665 RepID=A0A1C4UV12_9ACTN|nr:MFS transporter [Micromonospora coriariae]SCE75553.1 Major Facilitator Superfamily protein [Micromonospora coriariae]
MRLLPPPGPARVLTVGTLVKTVGRGLWLVSSALFLTRSVGLSATQVGVGLTISALFGVLASAPSGYLADRLGPRGAQVGGLIAAGTLTAGLIAVRSFPAFLLVGAATALADAVERGARGALIAGAIPADQRVHTRAYLRATTNVGISVGAVLGGFAIAADTRAGYVALILTAAVASLAAAAVFLRLPTVAPVAAPTHGPRLIALRDRPFLAFTLLDGLMSMHFSLLTIALPLWIAGHTAAPAWMISALTLVNTVLVVLLQVRAARSAVTLSGAARAARRAGVAIALACVLFAASGALPTAGAVGLLGCGALVHVIGELWHSAAGWGISFGLAPSDAQGQYQGAYGMGYELGKMLAPVVVTTLALGWGVPGWLVLGGLFLLLGALVPPVVRWAGRTRSTSPAAEPVTV